MRREEIQYGDAVAIVCGTGPHESMKRRGAKVNWNSTAAQYMSAPAAMAEDAIEIHPGTPNVYYIQKMPGEETGHLRGGRRVRKHYYTPATAHAIDRRGFAYATRTAAGHPPPSPSACTCNLT
jgi:aldehyde oxidoreductase